ncbi:MAG: EI24 domain-containing protein [Pseudomonadota bacterium]
MFPFAKTFSSLRKADLMGLIIICALLAVVMVVSTVVTISWVTANLVDLERGWLDTLVNWLVGAVTGIAGWFMLPPLVILIAGIFQEKIIHKVEMAFYPDKVRSEEPRFWGDVKHDVGFALWALFLNILILPLYFFGIGFFASIGLNSYLLGREFFEGAAGYHLGKPEARRLVAGNRRAVYGGGFFITLMTLVPLLNLLMPILATVWMVHVYHGLGAKRVNA